MATVRSSVRAAFEALIDYAGLFPPAELPLTRALTDYQAAQRGPHAWILGRFIMPALQLSDSVGVDGGIWVIVDPDVDALNRVAQLRRTGTHVEALEIPLQKSISPYRVQLSVDEVLDVVGALEADLAVAELRDLPTFVEVPRTGPWRDVFAETIDAVARLGLSAKIRCGGVTAEAFPSVTELAGFIAAAHDAGIAFKATAGLHHPLRHVDRTTGFPMHGFLNILAASALAPRVDRATLERVIAEEEPAAFIFDDGSFWWRNEHVDVAELVQRRRKAFVGYGSCSFTEPIDDLTALGIISAK